MVLDGTSQEDVDEALTVCESRGPPTHTTPPKHRPQHAPGSGSAAPADAPHTSSPGQRRAGVREEAGTPGVDGSPPGFTSSSDGDPRAVAEAHRLAGNAAYKAARWNDAIEAYTRAIEASPEAASYANRAAACLNLRRYAAALEDAQAAVGLDAGYARGHHRAAKAAMYLGRIEEAQASYAVALELEPQTPGLRDDMTSCVVLAGCVDAAKTALDAGDASKALASATRGLERAPACQLLHVIKTKALLLLGRASEAVAASRELEDVGSVDVLALRQHGARPAGA